MKLNSKNYVIDFYISDERKPMILVLPGGGYTFTSEREGSPVAKFFNEHGYHSAVYYYRETKLVYPEIFLEAKAVVETLKNDPRVSDIVVIGFSAGGHLASYLLTVYKTLFKAGILAYPVIAADPKIWHEDSFNRLLDGHMTEDRLKLVSSDLLVSEAMPPVFIWHTVDDNVVPIENSMRFLNQMVLYKNAIEAHFFENGRHGLSLINELTTFDDLAVDEYLKQNKVVAVWKDLMIEWLSRLFITK